MNALDLLRFALQALRGHRLRSILTLLGVTIGVAAVVLLTALGEGARLYVTGRLVADKDSLRATASLWDRANADREVGRAEAHAGRGELFALADQLVRGLVADRARGPAERLARVAATSTRSLPALTAFLEGNRVLVYENGVLVGRQVKTGLRNWEWGEVTEGLKEKDTVVVSLDRAEVKEGARARIESEQAGPQK